MDLSSVILGPVVTEKAETLKQARTHMIRVHPHATKIDVKNALKRFYDIDVQSVRVLNTLPKYRMLAAGRPMEKRHRSKRMMITLSKNSPSLDLAKFMTTSA